VVWVIRIVTGLIAMVGVVAFVGWLLPVGHEATRSADFRRPPEIVFALISDLDNYSKLWPEGTVRVAVVERVPPSRLVTRIVGETAFGGTWTIEIVPTPEGARMTVTERGEVYNVIFRALSRFVLGHTSTIESFLSAARTQLG
jgi:hypothetical protein